MTRDQFIAYSEGLRQGVPSPIETKLGSTILNPERTQRIGAVSKAELLKYTWSLERGAYSALSQLTFAPEDGIRLFDFHIVDEVTPYRYMRVPDLGAFCLSQKGNDYPVFRLNAATDVHARGPLRSMQTMICEVADPKMRPPQPSPYQYTELKRAAYSEDLLENLGHICRSLGVEMPLVPSPAIGAPHN